MSEKSLERAKKDLRLVDGCYCSELDCLTQMVRFVHWPEEQYVCPSCGELWIPNDGSM